MRGAPHDPGPGRPPLRHDARFWVGLGLTLLGCAVGFALLVEVFVLSPPLEQRALILDSIRRASAVAYLPVALYLFLPFVLDRYDPEPAWALLGVFAWGALFAAGAAAFVNTQGGRLVGALVGDADVGELYSVAVSAPVFEELFKGIAIAGMVVFVRREFDGVVDGIVYATFVAIGFAATENIVYYARADLAETMGSKQGALEQVFLLRGVLTPWLHPLFTAMTGLGFGWGRESVERWKKVSFPLAGYVAAVLLHAWWNGLPRIMTRIGMPGGAAFGQALNLVVGLVMALTFGAIVCALVIRKGRIMQKHLYDELLIGTLSEEEYALVTSYGGRLRARLSWRGRAGANFVAAGARLALCKYHAARAMQGRVRTVSADFIVPLRQELVRWRHAMGAPPR